MLLEGRILVEELLTKEKYPLDLLAAFYLDSKGALQLHTRQHL
jgi:hypothetical protein